MSEADTASPTSPTAGRRGWLVLAGAAALAAGVAWQWRSRQDLPGQDPAEQQALSRVWGLTLKTPLGEDLALERFRGQPLLVNFWATWCPPCVRELPTLQRFHRTQAGQGDSQGVRVLGLAIDGQAPVREFLGKLPVDYAIGLAGTDGTELVRALGNAQGALPYTVLVDASGRIRHRKLGEVQFEELQSWARDLG